jgi:catechol 2,3-dioxygenase-like lactoylglutathione lyase family enzyme
MADLDGLPVIKLLVLYCADLQACGAFYARLGLKFTSEQHGKGREHLAAVMNDGCVVELYPVGQKQPTHPLRIGLSVSAAFVNLSVGQHLLQDPDGRTVVVDVSK